MWFGWSGRSVDHGVSNVPDISKIGSIRLATLDLTRDEAGLYYSVFSNQSLWPLLHNFPSRTIIRRSAYRAYRRVNHMFAQSLGPLLKRGDTVWVHDYHLIPLGYELRRGGWKGKLGFFLHTPFPSAEVFAILPWSSELLEALTDYDLVGVHTGRSAHNLLDALRTGLGGTVKGRVFTHEDQHLRVAVHPVGTDPDAFAKWAGKEGGFTFTGRSLRTLGPDQRIVVGVDRLDYTKGIPQRLLTFERLLEHYPSLRGKVSMIQVSAPSRTRVQDYVSEKNLVDQIVGRVNGRFAEANWVPIHYLYRTYSQQELAALYRVADVCLVTPLRDGMNLVAKEFIACQGDNPGVLVLSRFTGASETMKEALIVNPYDMEGTADSIYQALSMPAQERIRRRQLLKRGVWRNTAQTWRDAFLSDLAEG